MGIIDQSQAIIDEIGAKATAMQDTASNPINNVWVGASAGTGKTKVLTDRILRLLLPPPGDDTTGVDPSKILGITFTKAGASEMVARVTNILSNWAVCEKETLQENLDKLLGYKHSLNQFNNARQLFASVTDTANGLNITTIHAFCQSLLGRFPIEAELSPQFQLIEEGESRTFIQQARNSLITQTQDTDTSEAFYNLATWKNGDSINKIIANILSDQEKLSALMEKHGSVEAIIDAVYSALEIDKKTTQQTVLKTFFDDENYPQAAMSELIEALNHGSDKNKDKANALSLSTKQNTTDKISNYDKYRRLFIKADGDLYGDREITKGAKEFNPNARALFDEEAKRIQFLDEKLRTISLAQSTAYMIKITFKIINKYNELKLLNNVLDYNDLIIKARDLLYSRTPSGRMMTDWILYKIDGGIDHILVDEAQDTNPIQWQIIEKITDEFFDGDSAREHNPHRSVFVVGDEKQSIFRFQGAEPHIFDIVKTRLGAKIGAAQKPWKEVPMDTSFRSVGAILELTDSIFNITPHHAAVTQQSTPPIEHTAYRYGQAGHIELWPPYKAPKSQKREPWALPTTITDGFNAKNALAKRIASTIRNWIDTGEELLAKGRPINAGDIMVLVRSRNSFVDHLIAALKSENVPVSGVDRMVVSDQIAVQDIIAALSFAMMPEDDLVLASLLKSPFIGWNDRDIEEFAHGRGKTPLWTTIKTAGDTQTTRWLSHLIEAVSSKSSFDAITDILVRPTPANDKTGWQAITARLGVEAIDAVEELLSMAQNYDLNHSVLSIQGFLNHIESDKRDLKRELESGGNMVRIMTVHASKGLQSPIVFMPDTMTLPRAGGNSDDGFLWTRDNIPLWIKGSDDRNDLYKSIQDRLRADDLNEYYRLLYVAITRAEDRLIVCGHMNERDTNINEQSWYTAIRTGLSSLGDAKITSNAWPFDEHYMTDENAECLTFKTEQTVKPHNDNKQQNLALKAAKLPQWATTEAAQEQHPPKILSPSKMDDGDMPVRSPLGSSDNPNRFNRGLLTHSLLQYLPELPLNDREDTAKRYLAKHAKDIDETIQSDIIRECMGILNTPQFAPFFAEGSLSEIPVTGKITNPITGKTDIISGEIDRMAITDDTVWIIDYKSNRNPSINKNNISNQYYRQLLSYKALIQKMYPNHNIRTALLWTDGPHIMELDI